MSETMSESKVQAPDPERQHKARRYAHLRRRLLPVSLGLGLAWALGLLLSGAAVELRQFLTGLTTSRALVVTMFSGIVGVGYAILDLPLSYYSGFVLPHRFGLSKQSLRDWVWDQIKSGLLGGAFGLAMLQLLYLALSIWPEFWWVPVGVAFVLFGVVLSALAPILIVPLFYKLTPLEEEYQGLVERLKGLARKAGTRVEGVYRIDMSRRTEQANAALMGLGRSRRIVLGDTLLDNFSDDEIETVLAHELAHHVHHDIPLGILVQSAIMLGGLWVASLALQWGVDVFDLRGVNDIAGLPWLALVLGGFGLLISPLTNGWSRWREGMADRYAIETTGKPQDFGSAMVRLADQNLSEVDPAPWVKYLLYDHPPLKERIERARSAEQGPA
jgi:STE24 endopeptidase